MSKKIIGIVGFKNSDGMFGVTGNYMNFASKYGNVRVLTPTDDFVELDLLILPGGLDLNPASYGEIPGYNTSNPDVFKQHFFDHKLELYKGNTPIFGICLGFQMLNVAMGGKLIQDNKFHPQSTSRWATAHKVTCPLFKDGKDKSKMATLEVNSHHHQSVTPEVIGQNLDVWAFYQEGRERIVEAFFSEEQMLGGVQWHPEELYDWLSDIMVNELMNIGSDKKIKKLEQQVQIVDTNIS